MFMHQGYLNLPCNNFQIYTLKNLNDERNNYQSFPSLLKVPGLDPSFIQAILDNPNPEIEHFGANFENLNLHVYNCTQSLKLGIK